MRTSEPQQCVAQFLSSGKARSIGQIARYLRKHSEKFTPERLMQSFRANAAAWGHIKDLERQLDYAAYHKAYVVVQNMAKRGPVRVEKKAGRNYYLMADKNGNAET